MKNIALILRYDGSRYHGWQVQKNEISVAQTLEEALTKTCGHPVKTVGCGRTDAGVHARAQVCSFRADTEMSAEDIAEYRSASRTYMHALSRTHISVRASAVWLCTL